MDVKVIRNQESSAPHLQVLNQEYRYNGEPLPTRGETSLSQHYPSTLLLKDKPPLLKKETWEENKSSERQLIDRYHSETVLSLARKSNDKVFASHFLQGSAHFVKNKIGSLKENHYTPKESCNETSLSLKSKFSVYADRNENNAAEKVSEYATEQVGEDQNAISVKPSVGKAEIHTKIKGSGRKSKKLRSKSGKKKRGKSAFKKRKSHKNNENPSKEVILPVKKKLDSCFSLYTTQTGKEKSNVQTSYKRHLSDNSKSAGFLNIRTSGSKTSHGFREKKYLLPPYHDKSNKLNLPPTISRIKHPISVQSDSDRLKGSTPSNSNSVPLIVPVILRDIKSLQINREGISLPPAPINARLPTNSIKVTAAGEAQQRKNLIAKAYSREGAVPGKLSFDGKCKRDHSLGERLSLIHSYGAAYQAVTKQLELQQKKEQALKHQLCRAAERIGREKKKSEQRKKVYALNQLMTKLEHQKFRDFMDSLKLADPAADLEP